MENFCLQNCLDGFRDFDLRVGDHQMGHYVLSLSNFDQNHCFARLKTNQKVFITARPYGDFSTCKTYVQIFWQQKKSEIYRTSLIDNTTKMVIIPYLQQEENLIEVYRSNTTCHLLFEFLSCEKMKHRDEDLYLNHC